MLISWGTVRERVGARAAAAICALFVVAAPDLVSVLPVVSRQCYAILFLALLVFSIASVRLSTNSARVLALAAMVGIAITHYSTAYIAAVLVLGAAVLSYLLPTTRKARVLTLPVAGGTAAVVLLWDVLFARANSNLSQVVSTLSPGSKSGGTAPPPITRPGLSCTKSGVAATPSSTSLPVGVPHGGHELLAASSALTPPGTVAAGPATLAIAVVALAVAIALLYTAWRLFRSSRGAEPWKRIAAASLVSLVVLGSIGLLASRSAALARLVKAPFRAFVTSPSSVSIADASKVRSDDLFTLAHTYDWMRLATGSCETKLVSFPPARATGVPVLASVVGVTELLASKLLILVAVTSVLVCLAAAFKDRRLVGLSGMGVAAIAAASVWKFVPAMVQFFGTDRIQIETYFVFAATAAAAVQWLQSRRRDREPRSGTGLCRGAGWLALGLVAAVVLAGSMGLINLVTGGRPLEAAFSLGASRSTLRQPPPSCPPPNGSPTRGPGWWRPTSHHSERWARRRTVSTSSCPSIRS